MTAKKKQLAEMQPIKKWLTLQEACSYINIGRNNFLKHANEAKISQRYLGAKKYYHVDQINQMIDNNILIK